MRQFLFGFFCFIQILIIRAHPVSKNTDEEHEPNRPNSINTWKTILCTDCNGDADIMCEIINAAACYSNDIVLETFMNAENADKVSPNEKESVSTLDSKPEDVASDTKQETSTVDDKSNIKGANPSEESETKGSQIVEHQENVDNVETTPVKDNAETGEQDTIKEMQASETKMQSGNPVESSKSKDVNNSKNENLQPTPVPEEDPKVQDDDVISDTANVPKVTEDQTPKAKDDTTHHHHHHHHPHNPSSDNTESSNVEENKEQESTTTDVGNVEDKPAPVHEEPSENMSSTHEDENETATVSVVDGQQENNEAPSTTTDVPNEDGTKPTVTPKEE